MKAFTIDRYKSKDGGRIVDMPQPEVGDNDVLVQVHAAGVNLLDAKIADGEFKILLPYRFPLVLGNDVAGVVVEVGARVRRFKPGDEVYARPDKDRIGTFAEFIAMNEGDVAITPTHLSMEEAASIPLVGLTAWQALVEMANLKPGRKSSSRQVRAASARSRSSWRNIWVRRWLPPQAPPISSWSKASARMS
jgi:NADPH:quinone reductase-like Zn-dependent oxidoreductase